MSDSDWSVRRSTSGSIIQWHKACIDWGSSQQPSISLSSCKAEVMAGSETTKSVVYFRNLLEKLGFPQNSPTPICVDNKAAIDLAYSGSSAHHKKSKHILRRHFFMQEMVENKSITVPYIKTAQNVADYFTKALTPCNFFKFRKIVTNEK